ncbi:MAG: DUF6159 family protein [Planctomycetota bacterium]|nr:DUF6159 family protein [Planctomycetota bacterium]
MLDKFTRSWELTKQSWAVLRAEKGLVLFPILSSITSLAIVASFAVPIALAIDWSKFEQDGKHGAQIFQGWHYPVLFVLYVLTYFITTFFNAGLIACVNERLEGRDTNVGFGLKAAAGRIPQIFGWSVLNATVGVVIQMIADRLGWVGQMILRFIGMAWAIATFFVVPVLVLEGVGPIDAVKRSVSVLKKNWGEAGITTLGFSAVATLAGVLWAIVTMGPAIALMMAMRSPVPLFAGIAAFILGGMVLSVVVSTMQVIVRAALYRFAATGAVAAGFDESQFRSAFAPKKK